MINQSNEAQSIASECVGQTNAENLSHGKQGLFGSHGNNYDSTRGSGYRTSQITEALRTSLEESKKNAKKEVNSILEKILIGSAPKEPAHIKVGVPRVKETVIPDVNVANLLAKTFERVRHSKRTRLTETGNELDIEALIQAHNKGYGNYIQIYVSTPLSECERRDVKGLYKKARAGEIKNYTGIDSPYEEPKNPELEVDTDQLSIEEPVHSVMKLLNE